jgi:hypothetical protein
MNRAVPNEIGSAPGHAARAAPAWIAAALLLGAGAVSGAETAGWTSESAGFTPVPLAAPAGAGPAPGSRIEISASNLPRFDNFDGSNRTQQRIDMALLSPGRSAFGVTLGVTGLSPSRHGLGAGPAENVGGVNLGLQWRYVFDDNRRIDITAWRDVGRPNDALAMIQSRDAGYGARVEMQLTGSRSGSGFVADRGFVGVQLDGGARITLRRSGGKPMVYYRNKF